MVQNHQKSNGTSTGDWLKERLMASFDNTFNAMRFIDEKKQMLNGKLYKYCPISDNIDAIQYSINNLKSSIAYMSRISNFNDPFDTYISFSMNEIIQSLLSQSLSKDSKIMIDEKTKKALPTVFGLIMNNEHHANKNTKAIRFIIKCISEDPSILTGEHTPEVFLRKVFPLLAEEISNGNISLEELSSFSDIETDPGTFIAGAIQEFIHNPQLLKHLGYITEEDSLTKLKELLNGKSPQFEAVRENYRKTIEQSTPALTEAIKKIRTIINEKYYITCFSTGYDNALMWAHYTNKHKGFCIEYNLDKTKDLTFMINLYPVIYSTNRASVPLSLFDLSDMTNIRLSTSNESTADMLCAMLTKSDVWKYENEWRLILYDEIKELIECKYEIDCIDKIILGCKIEEKYENEIMGICKEKGFHLSKMKLDDNAYQLHEDMLF